jgi:glutamine amidotransferase
MVGIIDYGLGNPISIQNMLKRVNQDSIITSDLKILEDLSSYILPGVGNFKFGMHNLEKLGLKEFIQLEVKKSKKPLLGICLGMQLLLNNSEEGNVEGLGLIDGRVVAFKREINDNLLIPHMGWNFVEYSEYSEKINGNCNDGSCEEERYYFVHSYHAANVEPCNIVATTKYGYNFPTIIKNGNFYGVQFHPEKSHKFGVNFFKSYFASAQ